MLRSTIPVCLALIAVGCGTPQPDVGETTGALTSCNADADCIALLPTPRGTCVTAACNNHACEYAMDATACPTGCTVPTQATDCNLGATNCFIVQCKAGVCDFSDYSASSGCECKVAGDCAPANSCQDTPTCNSATCTYTAKQPLAGSGCCNVTPDCGGTATCAANSCDCGAGNKFCPGATVGNGRCVPSAGCCAPTDCPAANACQTRTCSAAGACGVQSNGNAGCCDVPGDCAAHGNATAACTANTCVYSCDSGFHDCGGTCKSDTSPLSCGTMCSACPAGNACQAPACTSGACGFVAGGASPCCNAPGDCTPANACQTATACTANRCVFGSTGGSGCCNGAADCPVPSDACLTATCVANQCATAPVPSCSPPDLAQPADLAVEPPADLAVASSPDLSAPLSIAGGGGCSFVAARASASADGAAALALVALVLVAASLRRRA